MVLDVLLNRELYITGTVIKNKIPKSKKLKTVSEMMREGRQSVDRIVRSDKNISPDKWFDKKGVLLLSSKHGKSRITKCSRLSKKDKFYLEVDYPEIVKNLNECMSDVDHIDRNISFYSMKHRTNTWNSTGYTSCD